MTPDTRAAIRHALEAAVAAGAPGALVAVDAQAFGLSCTDAVGLFERDTSRWHCQVEHEDIKLIA